jgi:hypothetical protein
MSNECGALNPDILHYYKGFTFEDDGATLIMTTSTPDGSTILEFSRTETNVFFNQFSDNVQDTLRIISPDHFIAEAFNTAPPFTDDCTSTWDFTLVAPAESG